MDLKKTASQMLMRKLGGNADAGAAESALGNLLGEAHGAAALSGVVDKFRRAGLADAAKSWLGNGANQPVSPEQVTAALGADRVSAFAASLGVDEQRAAETLSDILPSLIDSSSRGGLPDAVGELRGLGGIASKFFE